MVVDRLEGGTAVAGRQYAVLIAINKYVHWMALQNPVKDAKEIKDILSRKYYISDFLELYDEAATKASIIKLFDRLISEAKPEDSILIFYAGHGHLDSSSNTGFWIPVDGGVDVYEQANWLPNSQIRGFISNLKARHIALIADSCFSGDFLNPTRGMAPTITNGYFKNAYAGISRQVLTSGASESVPDESQFTRQLKLTLEGNTSPYLDPLMLYNQIRLSVTKTTPLFGDLKDSGHQEGASFLLFLKENRAQSSTAEDSNPEEPSVKIKMSKVYGTATVQTDTTGTLYLDGVSQGPVPVGSLATIENLSVGPHGFEMVYDDGKRETLTVAIKMGKISAVEFSHTAAASSASPAAASKQTEVSSPASSNTPQPVKTLDGAPVPFASIKINGSFDKWNDIPPVVVSSPEDIVDRRSITRISFAFDESHFFVRFDIADKTPSSFFHQHNFDDSGPFYAIGMEDEEGLKNANIRLVPLGRTWASSGGGGRPSWIIEVGTREKDIFHPTFSTGTVAQGGQANYNMNGSSVEIAIPLTQVKPLLDNLGPGKRYRAYCWTGRYSINLSANNMLIVSSNAFSEFRQGKALGYFSFDERTAAPASPERPVAAGK